MATAPGVLDLSCERRRPHQNDSAQPSQNDNGVQDLLTQKKEFEQRIQSYNGEDPLELRYSFINWMEKNYPNKGLDNGLIPMLEQTLSVFKDVSKYKQDTRYIALLIKYINLKPNPLEMYKCLYNQGIGTACAILYHAWANQCEKEGDFKLANEIYLLGLNNKAEPLEDLKQVHLQLQLNVGRRMLGISDVLPNTPCRIALKKLQVDNQSSTIKGAKDDNKTKNMSERQGPLMKFQASQSDKENSAVLKKVKHSASYTSSLRKIKVGAPDTFKCPVAYFGPADPTKLVMYPKDKIYEVEGKEFQLEEIIAKLYEGNKKPRRYVACSQNDLAEKVDCIEKIPVAYFEPNDPNKISMYPKDKVYAVEGKEFQLEELKALEYENRHCKSAHNSISNVSENSVKTPNQGTPNLMASGEKISHDINPNISLLTNQSLTVATKEAIKVVRGMWNSPSPVSVKTCNVQASSEKQSEPFKVPAPYKPGFQLYTDESFSNPSTSKQPDQTAFKQSKPFIPSDVENIPFVPKTSSILRSKLKDKNPGVVSVVSKNEELGNGELGVCKLNSDEEENARGYQYPLSAKKQPFMICSDEIDTVQTRLVIEERKPFKNAVPSKNDYDPGASCSTLVTATSTSTHKSRFVIECDNSVINEDIRNKMQDKVNGLASGTGYTHENQYPHSSSARAKKDEPLILPFVPVTNDIPVMENEGKENEEPSDYNIRRPERRELSGVLRPSSNIPVAPLELQNQDKEFDLANDSCCTKAFAFTLPSSTPFNSQLKNFNRNSAAVNDDNTVTYCSYTVPEEVPRQTDLSVILEASKERYSSSSGSSSSGQTPYGPSMRNVNTFSEIKGSELSHISEESLNELEKSLSFLHVSEIDDPFCPELLDKLLAKIKFPLKHHSSGLVVMNKDAPVLRENCSVMLGKIKYATEKELGKGSYARVLKATHKGQSVALKYQKPAFVWEYYIACEIRKRLASSPMKNGFIEISQAYVFKNASILETEWGRFGCLLNVVNAVKVATGKPLKATVATFLCIQLFKIVEHLHKCNIIHADIKPDNFILTALPERNSSEMCLKLIDFGRSIDMTMFPKGTTFTKVVTTDGFQCNEMKENRPWTYQIDYYGLAGTAYCLLMGDYMKVIKRGGKWGLQTLLPRYLHRDVWQPIFQDLLNVESCASLPDLSHMRMKLEQLLDSMGLLVSDQLNSFGNIIQGH